MSIHIYYIRGDHTRPNAPNDAHCISTAHPLIIALTHSRYTCYLHKLQKTSFYQSTSSLKS